MPVLVLWAAGAGALMLITGYSVDKTGEGIKDAGEGIEKTSNGALKLAVVAGVGYVIAKKQGWL